MDTSKEISNFPMQDNQDALMAEGDKVVVAEQVIVALNTVVSDALQDVNGVDDWELERAFGLYGLDRAGVKLKLRELQETHCVERRKVRPFVGEVFMLANELLDSVDAHMSMEKPATRVIHGQKREVEPETLTDVRVGCCKVLVDLTL